MKDSTEELHIVLTSKQKIKKTEFKINYLDNLIRK